MKRKLWLLPFLLTGGLSTVYFLPQVGSIAGSAIRMKLPDEEGSWAFNKIPPSEQELGTLAKDTEFSKAMCFRARPGEFGMDGRYTKDRIDLSIVLSGYDLNNSIHRPERCMPAQGHTILSSTDRQITLDNGRSVMVKRLLSTQKVMLQGRKGDENAPSQSLDCITYYFFVGHDKITADHLSRTIIDMRDRLLLGMDQRWAYVSLSMWYGKLPWMESEISPDEADGKLAAFLADFADKQIDWSQVQP